MLAQRQSKLLLAAGGMVLASWALSDVVHAAAAPFMLSSATFKDGTMMPKKVANMNAPNAPMPNANCVGENMSPQLSWSGVPDGTKSFALTMVDPEGRGGTGVFHFVSYGIPANVTSFAEKDRNDPDARAAKRDQAGDGFLESGFHDFQESEPNFELGSERANSA